VRSTRHEAKHHDPSRVYNHWHVTHGPLRSDDVQNGYRSQEPSSTIEGDLAPAPSPRVPSWVRFTTPRFSGPGSPPRYRCLLGWLPASRLMPPRSGLERSDFVPWPGPADLRTAQGRQLIEVLETRRRSSKPQDRDRTEHLAHRIQHIVLVGLCFTSAPPAEPTNIAALSRGQ
jgi:hypothetical protein